MQFSIVTCNIRFGLAEDGINSWQYRKKYFASFFNDYRSDFFCAQEVNDFQADFLHRQLSDYDYIGKREPAPFFWQHNLIYFCKAWHCIHQQHFFLSPTPSVPSRSRDSHYPRQCTLGLFEKNRQQIIIVNTHFDFNENVQVTSARIILNRIAALPTAIPAVLVGDFNATPEDACYRVFAGFNTAKPNETQPFANAFAPPYPSTYHAFTGDKEGDHIDWILYRGAITPRDCRIIHKTYSGKYLSDHFPVYGRFKWKD